MEARCTCAGVTFSLHGGSEGPAGVTHSSRPDTTYEPIDNRTTRARTHARTWNSEQRERSSAAAASAVANAANGTTAPQYSVLRLRGHLKRPSYKQFSLR
eukprot:8603504-Pyramimonas_sp.AAC.2